MALTLPPSTTPSGSVTPKVRMINFNPNLPILNFQQLPNRIFRHTHVTFLLQRKKVTAHFFRGGTSYYISVCAALKSSE